MRARAAAGSRRSIACDDGEVRLGRALLKRTEVHAERHEAIDFRETAIDELHRERVARGGGDGEMEADVGRLRVAVLGRRVAPALAGVGANRLRQRRQVAQLGDLFLGGALGRPRGGGALEHTPHVERVVNRLHRDARDEVAVTGDAVEVLFLPEPRQAFAHRRAAHPMLARQHDFRQRRARAIPAVDDAGFDLAIGALDLGGDRTSSAAASCSCIRPECPQYTCAFALVKSAPPWYSCRAFPRRLGFPARFEPTIHPGRDAFHANT